MWVIVFAVVLLGSAWTVLRAWDGLTQVTETGVRRAARNRVDLRESSALIDLLERKEGLLAEGFAAAERGDAAARERVLAALDGVNGDIARLEEERPALLAGEEARERGLAALLRAAELGFGVLGAAGAGYALWLFAVSVL
ncbi:hypothetical protein [Actinorugispora endophytica]|uniref:Uncharacterized protein n=1 Tax=Actinorugispora endophytica TaxID=1605990 RepID=A0A4R6UE50_9ACTN|nr:hypothetical protein [Actinorugispora endophytica]TDQ45040.1 hypothetical protein EV190_13332 [Actinorugispora endophytica]